MFRINSVEPSIYKNPHFARVVVLFPLCKLYLLWLGDILMLSLFSVSIMKLLTKILLVLGVRVGIQLIFQSIGGDVVSAGSLADAVQEKIYTYNSILNILYLALWPALTLA